MNMVKSFTIILVMLFLGNFISNQYHMGVPGNVLGMAFLMISLTIGIVKLEDVEEGANLLTNHLAIFLIPASVGIFLYFDRIREHLVVILVPVLLSIIIGLVVTGKVVQHMASERK